jgi:hypothetical protein
MRQSPYFCSGRVDAEHSNRHNRRNSVVGGAFPVEAATMGRRNSP